MHEQTFTVSGMTCGHCVAAVTEELHKVPGVTDVAVILDGGNVTVRSDTVLDDEAVREAVDEAGYTLVS